MSTDLFSAVLLAILFIVLIATFEEGMVLIILGFLCIIVGWNLPTMFTLTAYGAWSELIRVVYGIIAITSFGKSYFTAKDIFKGEKNNG